LAHIYDEKPLELPKNGKCLEIYANMPAPIFTFEKTNKSKDLFAYSDGYVTEEKYQCRQCGYWQITGLWRKINHTRCERCCSILEGEENEEEKNRCWQKKYKDIIDRIK
jgi:hypothetical protein